VDKRRLKRLLDLIRTGLARATPFFFSPVCTLLNTETKGWRKRRPFRTCEHRSRSMIEVERGADLDSFFIRRHTTALTQTIALGVSSDRLYRGARANERLYQYPPQTALKHVNPENADL